MIVERKCHLGKYIKGTSFIGHNNKLSRCKDNEGKFFGQDEIINSWKNSYEEKVSRSKEEIGLRLPQFGALSAIRAHWATTSSPATIVLPTGTGKFYTTTSLTLGDEDFILSGFHSC